MSTKKFKAKIEVVLGKPMTPEAHLVNTTWFRMAIAGPLAVSMITACIFTIDTNLNWNLSPEGMNNFLNLFKLPIGIASLSLPLAAVVAANHRSMQTAQQIREQNSQNIFANHIQHRNYFFEFIKGFDPFKGIEVSIPKLYETLFPESVSGNLEPNRIAIDNFISEIVDTNLEINKEVNGTYQNNEIIVDSTKIKRVIINYYSHRELYTKTPYSSYEIENHKNLYQKISEITNELKTMIDGIILCANFHRDYIDKLEEKSLHEFEEINTKTNKLIKLLRPRQLLYTELRNSINEYVDDLGNFRSDREQSKEQFISRLASIPKDLRIKEISDDFRLVTMNYFTEREQELLRSNAPPILTSSI